MQVGRTLSSITIGRTKSQIYTLIIYNMSQEVEVLEACPVCAELLPVPDLQSHCEAHFACDQGATNHPQSSDVHCALCQALVAMEDWNSHELAHELEQPVRGAADHLGSDLEQAQRVQEQLQFEELLQRYGFADRVRRPGTIAGAHKPVWRA